MQRARAVLTDRLEKAYGPMYFFVGELLQTRLSGGSPESASRDQLRALLSSQGHHLREEHFRFCVDLLAGKQHSKIEILWHRQSAKRELEKLRLLLYGPASELEAALERGAIAVVLRIAARLGDYLLAAAFWLSIFAGLTLLLAGGIGHNSWLVFALFVVLIVARVVREVIQSWRFRRRFDAQVLRSVKPGSKGPEVVIVQTILAMAGYDIGPSGVDGIFGRETEGALRGFQRAMNLKLTGRLDGRTRSALFGVMRELPNG